MMRLKTSLFAVILLLPYYCHAGNFTPAAKELGIGIDSSSEALKLENLLASFVIKNGFNTKVYDANSKFKDISVLFLGVIYEDRKQKPYTVVAIQYAPLLINGHSGCLSLDIVIGNGDQIRLTSLINQAKKLIREAIPSATDIYDEGCDSKDENVDNPHFKKLPPPRTECAGRFLLL